MSTNSSWLNSIESYSATLQRTALHNPDYKTPEEINQALHRGLLYLNETPRAYKGKKYSAIYVSLPYPCMPAFQDLQMVPTLPKSNSLIRDSSV
jgi:hypothetical protein